MKFIGLLALIPLSLTAPAQPVPVGVGSAELHTAVKLVADVNHVMPGSTFTIGILMKMEKGWHTYWKNAGEAGLPTQIAWTLPRGFEAGEILWPLPHKYNEGGEVQTYGYEDENMLLVPIRAPVTLKPGTVITLKADVEWLECERICIPGNTSVSVTLPVASRAPHPENAALFEKYIDRVPKKLSGDGDIALNHFTSEGKVIVRIEPKNGRDLAFVNDQVPDFFPETVEAIEFGRTIIDGTTKKASITLPLTSFEPVTGPITLRGIIVYQLEGEQSKARTIAIPLSSEFSSTIPLFGSTPTIGTGLLEREFATNPNGETEQPLYLYIILAIVGGLLLNIMPCVLPVIGLKIFGLVRMSGDHPARVKKLGWFFSLGIMASFLALAAIVIFLKTAGEQVGWGFQFQEPLFVIAMCTIVFAFGLSLFGVFEVSLPFMLAFAGLGSALEKRDNDKGYVSSFGEGVFATVLATPCSAPFLGSAMGFAFSQTAPVILLIFASVAFGMAFPYLVLTAKPSWMRFLPKPGDWMVTAKQFMGFLMMATLLWLLYVLGKQLGIEAIIWTGAFLLVVGIACWVVGRYATLNTSRAKYAMVWLVALALVAGGYWTFLETILDVRSVIAGVPSSSAARITENQNGIEWQPFSLVSLESYLDDNRTVFIDFTADWCLTCKVNEKTVMTDEDVVQKFKANDIIAVRADWTNRNQDITKLLAKFGRSGVPLYVIFPAGKPNEPIVLPEVITTGIVTDAIDRATLVTSAMSTH